MSEPLKAQAESWRDRVVGGRPVTVEAGGKSVRLVVNRPSDFVMKEHLAGRFGFAPLLSLLDGVVSTQSRVLDVGAGFGNASVYCASILGAREVVPIEPFPEAAEILRANVELNGLDEVVDTSYLGMAFADKSGTARAELPYKTHLGGARIIFDPGGSLSVVRGDDTLGGRDFDIVLLDINGREVEALAGMTELLERCRPEIVAAHSPSTRGRLAAALRRRGYAEISSEDAVDGKLSYGLYRHRAQANAQAPHVRHQRGFISTWQQDDQILRFFVTRAHDSIQSCHAAGRLYEEEELAIIKRHVPAGSRILDCGANIGNHAIAFTKILGAARVVAIEPNTTAIDLLRINCALNDAAGKIDLTHVGVALGEREGKCRVGIEPVDNLGGTAVDADENGDVRVARGDDLLAVEAFDFIKIDVEGCELAVLEGLRKTIELHRPVLFVEVGKDRIEAFARFLASCDYEVEDGFQRYSQLFNFLAKPKSGRSKAEASAALTASSGGTRKNGAADVH